MSTQAPLILILGAPGAGKGTQAKMIAEYLGVRAISTGAIFRENIKAETELGTRANAYISKGEFVPDSVTNPMVTTRLDAPDVAEGCLLDGYPRTLEQAHYLRDALVTKGKDVDLVIEICTNEEEVIQRLLKRAEIEHRADDTEEVIRHRMDVYRKMTEPMATYYADQDKLVQVDGMGTIEDVWTRIQEALQNAGFTGLTK